jgi:hypothetical protein
MLPDCGRPGPKPFLGTECVKEIYEPVTQLQKFGHGLGHKEVQRAGEVDSKRVIQVLKNTLPSKLWYKSILMQYNFSLQWPENLSVAQSTVAK